jgi:hypothetical protein
MGDLQTVYSEYSPNSQFIPSILSFFEENITEPEPNISDDDETHVSVNDIKSFSDLKISSRNISLQKSLKEETQKRCIGCQIF